MNYKIDKQGYIVLNFIDSDPKVKSYSDSDPKVKSLHDYEKTKDKKKYRDTITVTFGDQAENHVGMQKLGELAKEGFTIEDLNEINKKLEHKTKTEYIILGEGAAILIIKNDILKLSDNLYDELSVLDFDKKALMYGRVVNKKARYNLCFADMSQEPAYDKGKGRVIDFQDLPILSKIRKTLPDIFGAKAKKLVAEGNYYHDIDKSYIGYHGDTERKKVIALRLGHAFPLYFQWYLKGEKVGKRTDIMLDHGDIYIMSEKATGNDWKSKNKMTLRHAAGFNV